VQSGGGWSTTNFNTAAPFSVQGSGFAFEGNFGCNYKIADTPWGAPGIGARLSTIGSNINGSGLGSNDAVHWTKWSSFGFAAEATVGMKFHDTWSQGPYQYQFEAGAGLYSSKLDISASNGAFDSTNFTGFTASVRAGVSIPDSPVWVTAQFRYINLPSTNIFNGAAPISGSVYVTTVGLQMDLVDLAGVFRAQRNFLP
jgi:hypothetical protein